MLKTFVRIIPVIVVFLFIVSSGFCETNWKRYPYDFETSDIVLPNDEGAHNPLPELEWWYVVMHVSGAVTNNKYSILVTHFNNGFRFFTVTDITDEKHESGTALGLLNAEKGKLDLTQLTQYGLDYMRTKTDNSGNLVPFEYQIETHYTDMHLSAEIKAEKPPMLTGDTGYVPIGSSGFSWYYSLTNMTIDGTLTFDGVTEPISGKAWLDHQWGPFVVSPVEAGGLVETYEWFCIQLDNNEEIMISNIYNRDYDLPQTAAYGGVQYNRADGTKDETLEREFTRTGFWHDPESDMYMSMGWKLDVPEWDMHLVMEPEFKHQMVRFPLGGDFWEGSILVSGTINGVDVTGRSFGELIHKFKVPELNVYTQLYPYKLAYKPDEGVTVLWEVKNPDAGNPLTFDVDMIYSGETISLATDIKEQTLTFHLSDVITDIDDTQFKLRVSAFSVDKTITGDALSPTVYIRNGTDLKLFQDDGIVQPESYHQRYRRDEFDQDKPFYQWWYYTIKDLENNRYFAFDYSISDCADDPTNKGSYMMFAMVDKNDDGTSSSRFHKYERFPLPAFSVENDFDVTVNDDDGNPDFTIEVIDDDTWRVKGKMNNAGNVWFTDGMHDNDTCNDDCLDDLHVEWDLVINRIYGWYGQDDLQELIRAAGIINWNTYSHDSIVEGTITVGNTTYDIKPDERFRAYCDMNWGESFPKGEPAIDYPWGWYYVGKPDNDPENEFSIIAGIGCQDLVNSLGSGDNGGSLTFPGIGKFADIRIDAETHIGVRSLEGLQESPSDDSKLGFSTTNDGAVKQYDIDQGQWVKYSDSLGSAYIPLYQKITIETNHYLTEMAFQSEIDDYNRLLFPHEDYIFSDFEALGVDVHVVIHARTVVYTYKWWDLLKLFPKKEIHYEIIKDFRSDDGGLEYGYNVEIGPVE